LGMIGGTIGERVAYSLLPRDKSIAATELLRFEEAEVE